MTRLALASLLLAACPSQGSIDVRFGRYVLSVPAGWEVRRSAGEEPGHSALVLVPEGKTLLCRLEAIRSTDGRPGSAEVDSFLELARVDFAGAREEAVELVTPVAVLRGFAVRQAVRAKSRMAGAPAGASEIEVYAGISGSDLLAAIAGGYRRDPNGRKLRDECLDALRSIRIQRR